MRRTEVSPDELAWFAFKLWMKRANKSIAIEKIKSQPFFRPRGAFCMDMQWSPEIIQAMRAADSAPLEINRICGIDLAAHDGDRTAVWAEEQGRMDARSRYMGAMMRDITMAGEDISTRAYRALANTEGRNW